MIFDFKDQLLSQSATPLMLHLPTAAVSACWWHIFAMTVNVDKQMPKLTIETANIRFAQCPQKSELVRFSTYVFNNFQ